MKKIFYFFLVLILGQLTSTTLASPSSIKKKLRIIIDYGYSTKNQTTIEVRKQKNLKTIAKKLHILLRRNGYKSILMARKNNHLSLTQKIELANQLKAFVFFSLSLNSNHLTKTITLETSYPPYGKLFRVNPSKILAQHIQRNLTHFFEFTTHQNTCELSYNTTVTIPKIHAFIETKIITSQNKKEPLLTNSKNQNKLAYSLYKSFETYVSIWQ